MLNDEGKKALNQALTTLSNTLLEVTTTGKNFVKENAPEVAKEIILFNGYVKNFLYLAGNLLLLFVVVPSGIYLTLTKVENFSVICWSYALLGLLVIGSLSFAIDALVDLLKAVYAPRVYLIEYAKDLLQKDSN